MMTSQSQDTHDFSSLITRSNSSLSNETDSESKSFSIPYIDTSSIDDFDSKHDTGNSLTRQISLSETDLLASIHRTKQNFDPHSEHDIPDDILFLEWDKERNLYQDYINSLRKEIRVLLQERAEYQTQKRSDDQTKIDLLQKSLEEKNLVIGQFQTDSELLKERNTNFIRKITSLESDTKSNLNLIDELKQKITDLTIDLQNHILIKRRLDISINNLESDCKIIDTERIKLTNEMKENQHNKQELEKLLQKANVQIAELGKFCRLTEILHTSPDNHNKICSTIEMLRSENVQVRSQLSSVQRRTVQEKQQIMDYLRQIEADLIEKEQIKQREALLRQDYEQLQVAHKQDRHEIEQLKNSINQDQQTIEDLKQQCSVLLHEKNQLDMYRTEIKPSIAHSHESIDQLIPIMDNQHQIEQTSILNEKYKKLQEDFDNLNERYQDKQAWTQYQQNQLLALCDRLQFTNGDRNTPFDELLLQIENRFANLKHECDTLANHVILLQANASTDKEGSDRSNEDELRKNLAVLTNQCAQLEEANRAWQQFQRSQLESFRLKLQHRFPLEDKISFDEIAEIIVDQVDSINRQDVSPLAEDISLRNVKLVQSAPSTTDDPEEELRLLRDNISTLTAQCAQLDEANRAWPIYHQTQLQNFQNELQQILPLSENVPFDQLPPFIRQQIDQEKQHLQQLYDDLQLESATNLQTIKQSYTNTVNELTQELSVLKEQLDKRSPHDLHQLDEARVASNENGDRISVGNDWEDVGIDLTLLQTPLDIVRNELGNYLSDDTNGSFEEVVRGIGERIRNEREKMNERYDALEKLNQDLHSESEMNLESIRQSYLNTVDELNQELMAMKERCEQLDAEKQSLNEKLSDDQLFEKSHLEAHSFREQLRNLLSLSNEIPSDEIISSLDQLIQENLSLKQNEDSLRRDLENVNEQLINIYNQCEQLQENNKQLLLEKQTLNQNISIDDDQLKADYTALQNQCTQLDAANRAWQLFYDNQMDLLRNKFQDSFNFDQNENFEQIIEIIVEKLDQERQKKDSVQSDSQINAIIDSLRTSQDTEQMDHLQQEIQSLEEQLKDSQSSLDMLTTNLQLITEENTLLKQQNSEIKQKNSLLIDDNNELNNRLNELQSRNIMQISSTDQSSTEDVSRHLVESVHSSNDDRETEEIEQLKLDVTRLTLQCAQLDEANRAWQQFHQNQLELLRDRFQGWFQIDPNSSFEQIIQQIFTHLNQSRLHQQSTLQNENLSDSYALIDSLQKQLSNYQNNESILVQNLEQLNQRLLDVYKQCEEFRELNSQLILSKQQADKELEEREKQIYELQQSTNQKLHLSSENLIEHNVNQNEEDILQHSTDHTAPTTEHSEPRETNSLQLNEIVSLDQLPPFIRQQIDQEKQHLQQLYDDLQLESATNLQTIKQSYTNTVNELTQELSVLKEQLDKRSPHDLHQLDEARVASNENGDRISVGNDWEDVGIDLTSLQTPLDIVRNDLGDYLSDDTNGSFEEVVRGIGERIRNEREKMNERYDALEKLNLDMRLADTNMESVRQSCLSIIKDLNEELLNVKAQCTELDIQNKQLLIEISNLNGQLNDRSLVLGHHSSSDPNFLQLQSPIKTNGQFSQHPPSIPDEDKLEIVPVTIDNHPSMIDKDIQTESLHQLWPTFDEENLSSNNDEDEERLNDYMIELASRSPTELADLLNKECQQILDKQKFNSSSFSDLDLNQLSLIALHSLHNQHLIDDAKSLYNETVVRALKQEYELLNNEKNDLIEQLTKTEQEYFQAKDTIKELTEKYEIQKSQLEASLSDLEQENRRLKNELNQHPEQIENDQYELLQKEFDQLKQENNDLVNENELLKDYNAQMFQEKLQEKRDNDLVEITSSRDADIQSHLKETTLQSDWNDQTSLEEEIERLKTTIDEVQLENDNLKDLNSQLYNSVNIRSNSTLTDIAIQCSPLLVDNSDVTSAESNDWNDQSSRIEESTLSSITETNSNRETVDNETQTDGDQQQDKLVQVNSKLKRALQTMKDKINRFTVEQSELFPNPTEDTLMRLDQLIATLEQFKHDKFRNNEEIQDLKAQLTERNEELKQNLSNTSAIGEYQNQIAELTQQREQLQQQFEELSRSTNTMDNESQTDEQQKDKLVQVNTKLKRALQNIKDRIQRVINEKPELFPDPGEDTMERLDQLIAIIENQAVQIQVLQSECDQTRQEVVELQNTHREQRVEKSSEELSIEDYRKQVEQLQQALDRYKTLDQELDTQAKKYEHNIDLLQREIVQQNEQLNRYKGEHTGVVTATEVVTTICAETAQAETQTDDRQHDKLVQVNNKLKRALQGLKDKIHRFVLDRPDLFDGIGEETSERLDNLIFSVENQATQIDKLQDHVNELESSLEALRNEQRTVTSSDDASTTDDYRKQVNQLQQALSEKDQERSLLREHLNEVEIELRKALDDNALVVDKYELLKQERDVLVEESQHEITQLQEELNNLKQVPDCQHEETQTDDDIQTLRDLIGQQSQEIIDLKQTNSLLSSEISSHAQNASLTQTVDSEVQTDDRQQEKLAQINTKLKRALQGLKDKIQRIAAERSELFEGVGGETGERLDHLIATLDNQYTKIDVLQTENDQLQEQLRKTVSDVETSSKLTTQEPVVSVASSLDEHNSDESITLPTSSANDHYLNQIDQLQQALAEKDQQKILLQQRLDELEQELRKALDDHASLTNTYEAFVEQQALDSEERQQELDALRRKLGERDEDTKMIKDLKERNMILSSELESQVNCQPSIETVECETQTEDRQHEKLTQMNTKLKRALQGLKDKIHRLVSERPDLFAGISEETNERLDHLISTVENQAIQLDSLRTEYNQMDEKYQDQMKQLENELQARMTELDDERRLKMDEISTVVPVTSSPPADDKASLLEEYQNQIEQLQRNLSEKDEERDLLREYMNEIETEFRQALDKHAALEQERDALLTQQSRLSAESEHTIRQLQEELIELKQLPVTENLEIQTNETMKSWNELVKENSDQIAKLYDENTKLSSQVEMIEQQKKEIEEHSQNYEKQLDELIEERRRLQEEIERMKSLVKEMKDTEVQTDDGQQEKLTQMNTKLKRALQGLKDKIYRLVSEKPDLFDGIGEDTSERLDHLIATIENQAAKINLLQTEHAETEVQLRNNMRDLQSSLEASQKELEYERHVKIQPLSSSAPAFDEHNSDESTTLPTSSTNDHYLNQIDQLQQALAEKDQQKILLQQRLDELEQELRKALDDHASLTNTYEAFVEQQALDSEERQQELDALRRKLGERDEDIKMIEDLKERNMVLSSELESQMQIVNERKQIEDQLIEERARLLQEIQKRSSQPTETIESESQTDDSQTDKTSQTNTKLKRALQGLKEKLHQLALQKPEFFDGIGDETDVRFNHVISTVGNQAAEIEILHTKQRELEEQLGSTKSDATSSANIEEYRNEFDQLRVNLAEKEEERVALAKRLTEIENELKQITEDNESLKNSYEEQIQSFLEERSTLFENQAQRFAQCEHEIIELKSENERLQEELTKYQHTSDCQDAETQTSENIQELHDLIQQQAEELKSLEEKCQLLSSQIDSNVSVQTELQNHRYALEQQLNDYKAQTETLSEEIERMKLPSIQTVDNESQTVDEQSEKLTKGHKKLKRTYDGFQEKIQELVSKRPDLFEGISEETNERLNQLISTVENQTKQITDLQNERDHLISSSLSPSIIEDYQMKYDQLQQTFIENEAERISLQEHLDELRETLSKYESSIEQTLQSNQSECQHIQVQTDDDNEMSPSPANPTAFEIKHRMHTIDSEIQTDDYQYEKMKAALAKFEEKIHGIVEERRDLFDGISDETDDRLDHLISTLENQATQISTAEIERNEIEEQLRNEIKQLENSISACQHELESERRIRVEQLTTAPPVEEIGSSVIEEYEKQINELHSTLSENDKDRLVLQDRLNQVETELQKLSDDHTSLEQERDILAQQSQQEIAQLRGEISELKQVPEYQHVDVQTDEDMKSLDQMIEQLKDLDERNAFLITTLENQKNIVEEHPKLVEELEKYMSKIIVTHDSEIQTDDDQHQQLFEDNLRLKSTIETIENKIDQYVNTRSDVFGDDLNARLESIISLANKQPALNHESVGLSDSSFNDRSNESDDWFDASPVVKTSSANDIEAVKNKILQMIENHLTLFSASNENLCEDLRQIFSVITDLQARVKELQSAFDTYRNETENKGLTEMHRSYSYQSNDADTQTLGLSIIEEHQKQIEKLQENESGYQREIQRLIEERDQARDLLHQYKKRKNRRTNFEQSSSENSNRQRDSHEQILAYQSQISNLEHERLSLIQQIEQLTSQPSKTDIENQTLAKKDLLSTASADQSISRHIFEQEMLAWSNESEELRRLVKQIQIENKKLKGIILKFENMVLDYVHENERLKQENQNLSLHAIHHPTSETDHSERDICYLTLKWLTYEVAQRTAKPNAEQLFVLTTDESDRHVNENEQRIRHLTSQNERLKNQLESYTIQFKHLQHDTTMKTQEISNLKDDIERLRTNEIQYRLEADRLKTELQDDQIKIQQLEHDLSDWKFKQSNQNTESIENLRELLDLKERELNALKDKLDYTKQTHQIELQEAMKAKQFSLDNVKHYEQAEVRYKEKRRELDARLARFCTITRPLLDNSSLFLQNPIINIDELRKLIREADTEERVSTSLNPIRDCLSLLEAQMRDLHHGIIENHARRSKRWKYKLGFECLSCESRWEVTHDIRDLQEACLDPSRFLESSIVEPMAGCSCPIMIDFVESDVRLCVDDIVDDVIARTTVK
ncbi:unnamed protein product [Adineta ricciae]|uniref:Uncharacterized protein n=1 Tax=Adineta ricciae TaxID=249248 RepID=A0A814D577_ADIRI|nr:unnamed protein product [Adineta ricciae]